jgi:trk system potassium uptake protein
MLLRPDRDDLRVIGLYLGRVSHGLALLMAAPALVGIALGEWDSVTALLVGAGIAAVIGQLAELRLATDAQLGWGHGAVVVAAAWLLGSVVAAVPFALSGHLETFSDAWFEAMSGLTTSGLTLVQDLDHLSYSMNLYRHLTHFAGGQGIVIVVLVLFATGAGSTTLYAAEGRDERIVPNILRTARFIFAIASTYLVVGTTALWVAVRHAGIDGWRAWWHAFNLFCAAFDTGGFTPTSKSLAYYHSLPVEAIAFSLTIAGALSFALHYRLWQGSRGVLKDIELRTLLLTLAGTTLLMLVGLVAAGTYRDGTALMRRGFFTMLSAHANSGFSVVDSALLVNDWGVIGPFALVIAMAIGGMAGSTAGGIKGLRLGLVAKGVSHDVRRVLAPQSALVVTTYESGRRTVLRTPVLRTATVLLLLYLFTFFAGAVIGLLYGEWTLSETLFESTSATANVGLSVGIVSPGMPLGLKLTYLVQMWLGRLEFASVFALVGFGVSVLRGRA